MHKCVIAFCMSLELVQSCSSKLLFVLYLAAFCLMSPLGIGVGIGISELPESKYQEFTVAFLQGIFHVFVNKLLIVFHFDYAALSGGTIIYCIMFEIIQRERQKNVSGMLQLLGIVLGFVGMLLIDINCKFFIFEKSDITS